LVYTDDLAGQTAARQTGGGSGIGEVRERQHAVPPNGNGDRRPLGTGKLVTTQTIRNGVSILLGVNNRYTVTKPANIDDSEFRTVTEPFQTVTKGDQPLQKAARRRDLPGLVVRKLSPGSPVKEISMANIRNGTEWDQ
jgi:hypothetical protein